MIKVMIADDHPVVRTGLRTILEEDADISVCDEAGSGPEQLACTRPSSMRCVCCGAAHPPT